MLKVRNKELSFETYDEWDEYCVDKDIQRCSINIKEKISFKEHCKRYNALGINIRTGKQFDYLS